LKKRTTVILIEPAEFAARTWRRAIAGGESKDLRFLSPQQIPDQHAEYR
jgi:hypothetical protein